MKVSELFKERIKHLESEIKYAYYNYNIDTYQALEKEIKRQVSVYNSCKYGKAKIVRDNGDNIIKVEF